MFMIFIAAFDLSLSLSLSLSLVDQTRFLLRWHTHTMRDIDFRDNNFLCVSPILYIME